MDMGSRVPLANYEHSGAAHSMNLLVLDSDADRLGRHAADRLSALGYNTHLTDDANVAVDMAAQGSARLILCCQARSLPALNGLKPGVDIILVTQAELPHDTLVKAMQQGVVDCWRVDAEDDIASRIDQALLQSERTLRALNLEVSEMRSELERDQRAGQYIQMGMLPPNPMAIGHFRLQHRVEPSLILSGDFVDYFQITDRYFACYVADVSGHGASSAFVTVLLKNFSRRLRREYRLSMLANPGEILSWINTELIDQGIDKHVAMFFATIDMREQRLNFANAAHFPPAAIVSDEGTAYLEQKGKPLGIFEDVTYETLYADFKPGARLVVFSDGVLDLIEGETLQVKEDCLAQTITECNDMDTLWRRFDASKIGSDDVSCLMVHHGR